MTNEANVHEETSTIKIDNNVHVMANSGRVMALDRLQTKPDGAGAEDGGLAKPICTGGRPITIVGDRAEGWRRMQGQARTGGRCDSNA